MSASRVAIVTGAANGIGRSISLNLAADGFNLCINDIEANKDKLEALRKELESRGRKVIIAAGDVSVEEHVKKMVDTTVKDLGGLDVMVANAGIIVWKPINISNLEDYEFTMNTNVKGVFWCYKYAGLAMIASGTKGKIIGCSSFAGKKGLEHCGLYCASKAAVSLLTQSYAAEMGKHGITVNAYAPGITETNMVRGMDQDHHKMHGTPIGALTEQLKGLGPLGRNGQPEDLAALVSFLASPGSNYITGQSISCNGGAYFD